MTSQDVPIGGVAPVLPDYLPPGLRVAFCGTAPGVVSATRGHYYAGPGNAFWTLLHHAGFTVEQLRPEDDSRLPSLGLGLTDLVKNMAQSDDRGLIYDVAGLESRIALNSPRWLAFTSKEAGGAAARHLGQASPHLGSQGWTLGGSRVFVLPSPSGRNQGRTSYDGRATRLEWWRELAELAEGEAS